MEEKNLPDRADELLTEWLNKDPLIPAAISTIPIFGSTLATFYSGKWLQIREERIYAMLQQFREHISNLDQRALRKDYLETPEGMDLLIQATELSSRTRSKEKRDLIARVLCGATIDYKQHKYSPGEYLHLISDLTVQELTVARTIYESRPDPNYDNWKAWEEETCARIGNRWQR